MYEAPMMEITVLEATDILAGSNKTEPDEL